ncbi:indole-3-glycerol phosphate synthase TrpC [Pseudothermotoga thermarum]|uniref:indole-3-glycerol-phosphate synthase n=1 Tax=Pseudothermotoga thermarum DSM 5069 TaxID=688269 RepID=F7YWY3_9THEM|nr:indole-3-glycerol phosphate synthase TrpC [Pseudothermotoga thermarum]AEH50575.1 indole-3-glycerol phosphate synthase [Pseudothermotoga thermarum DSM 5069]
MSVLAKILKHKRQEVEKFKQLLPIIEIEKIAFEKASNDFGQNKFKEIYKREKFYVIGEIKRSSPSEGVINDKVDVKNLAKTYETLGFFAVSVLTDHKFFNGSEEDLIQIKQTVSIPVLRKEFIIDLWQVYQTKLLNADAALLITKALSDDELSRYIRTFEFLNIVPLVEVENESEIEKALKAGAKVIGINNRNLNDLTVDVRKTERLLKYIPKEIVVISESGIKTKQDFRYIRSLGVDGCLIGTAFMRSCNPLDIVGE